MAQMNDPSAARSATRQGLTVLVPAFNEVENLRPTVDRLVSSLNRTLSDYEILIINDGSSDGTAQRADAVAAVNPVVVVSHNARNMGLGYCYRKGIELAR